jgi:hypothetical protein
VLEQASARLEEYGDEFHVDFVAGGPPRTSTTRPRPSKRGLRARRCVPVRPATYEIFAAAGGAVADRGINPIAAALNSRPKYVASTTLTDPRWANTTVLSREVTAAVGELRATPGRELQVHGSRCETDLCLVAARARSQLRAGA